MRQRYLGPFRAKCLTYFLFGWRSFAQRFALRGIRRAVIGMHHFAMRGSVYKGLQTLT
jgi:hypothetical protein